MADTLEVTIAGNLCQEVQIIKEGGQCIARGQIGTMVRHIRDGKLVERTVCLTIEIHGTAEAHTFAACNTRGSRVVLRGRLEQRQSKVTEQLPRADGLGMIAVHIEQCAWVVVVETILADGATLGEQRPLDGAQQHGSLAVTSTEMEAAGNRRRVPVPESAPSEQPPPRPWQWLSHKE